jgi:hypothetical protein
MAPAAWRNLTPEIFLSQQSCIGRKSGFLRGFGAAKAPLAQKEMRGIGKRFEQVEWKRNGVPWYGATFVDGFPEWDEQPGLQRNFRECVY